MREPLIVDTNVCVVANGATPHVSDECRLACVNALGQIRESGKVLIDDMGLVLREYLGNLHVHGQPGVGDRFFKWLWDNQGQPELCHQVSIRPCPAPRGFEEFPDDAELDGFDQSDRKFVAIALASALNPSILNASDSDWWIFGAALARNGIHIVNLCPDLIP